jgi:hypothetical protein
MTCILMTALKAGLDEQDPADWNDVCVSVSVRVQYDLSINSFVLYLVICKHD